MLAGGPTPGFHPMHPLSLSTGPASTPNQPLHIPPSPLPPHKHAHAGAASPSRTCRSTSSSCTSRNTGRGLVRVGAGPRSARSATWRLKRGGATGGRGGGGVSGARGSACGCRGEWLETSAKDRRYSVWGLALMRPATCYARGVDIRKIAAAMPASNHPCSISSDDHATLLTLRYSPFLQVCL